MSPSRTLVRLAVPLAALALVGGGLGTTAHAAPGAATTPPAPKAAVSVTIKLDDTSSKLMGTVTSPKAACKGSRPVALYFASTGSTGFTNVRTATSKTSGAWVVPGPGRSIPPGRYYVSIAADKTCKAAKSKTIVAAAG